MKSIVLVVFLVFSRIVLGQIGLDNQNFRIDHADSLIGRDGTNIFLHNVKIQMNGKWYLMDKVVVTEKKIITYKDGRKRKFKVKYKNDL